jgi:hypothetical protein
MSHFYYSELIFQGAEIAVFAERGEYSQAAAMIRNLNPLQAAYAFKFALESCSEVDTKILMDFIERVMNEGERS